MTLLFFLMFMIVIVQNIYIRYLKKEICLRDGTYKPKERKRFFRRRKDEP